LESDFTWCWRNKELEDNTIEISTKLLESIYLGVPAICYPSKVNIDLLGKDYPYFIKEVDNKKISELLNKKASIKIYETEKIQKESDIIFCEWGLANAVWYSQNKKENHKLIVRIHAQEVRKPAAKFMKQLNQGAVDKFIFVSEHIRDKAIDMFGIAKKKTIIIPNFVRTDQFFIKNEIKPLKNRQINLGILGIIPKTKRLDRAVDLLESLVSQNYNVHLYVKGQRPEELAYMQAPHRKKELEFYEVIYNKIDSNKELKKHITFEPWSENVQEWYQKIDIILSPSEAESFHYALADGMSSGCLPICWDWEGASKVYGKGFKTVKNIESGVSLFEEYYSATPSQLKKILHKNREHIVKNYSYEKIFKDLQKQL